MSSGRERNREMEEKLSTLSCPFTWAMEEIMKRQNSEGMLSTNQEKIEEFSSSEDVPLRNFIFHLMLVYEYAHQNDFVKAEQQYEQILIDIGEEEASNRAVIHILKATLCHLLHKSGKAEEGRKLLEEITPIKNMDKKELATLSACQSLAWSEYYLTDNMIAINHAREAVRLDQDNAAWHFILGKNLRRLRRKSTLALPPEKEETDAYRKAFELSKTPVYAVALAQCYRENNNRVQAAEMYKRALELNPSCLNLRLRLALGFIRGGDAHRALQCLGYVGNKHSDHPMYLHYMAIYFEKCKKDFKSALGFYQRAVDSKNYGAEIQYINCRLKVERAFDPLPYLLTLPEKYLNIQKVSLQQINLHIGSYYFFQKKDLPSASKYYLRGIEIDPIEKQLKWHTPFFQRQSVNVYQILANEIPQFLKNKGDTLNRETRDIFEKLMRLYRDHYSAIPEKPIHSIHMKRGGRRGGGGGRGQGRGNGSDCYSQFGALKL